MKPTIEDLQRLVRDARDEHAREPMGVTGEVPMARAAVEALHTAILLLAAPTVVWSDVFALALRALYLCALLAWEAGRRMGRADPPTAAETPAAKGVDADALLREADGRLVRAPGPDMVGRLAAALRAERARHEDTARCLGEAVGVEWQLREELRQGRRHLRAALDFMWPGDGGPTVVQKARAFLRGKEQATRHDDAREAMLRETELVLRCEARESRVAVDKDLHPADIARELGRQLRSLRHDLSLARAQLATEDEAAAHVKARLVGREREIDVLREANREALAAQNRAEGEASALRIENTDLRRRLAEGDALVDHMVARAKKGRA